MALERKPPTDAISLDDARARAVAVSRTLDAEEIGLDAALGRVLRQNAEADCDLPPSDVAVMDGYCLRASDTAGAARGRPISLRIVGIAKAGGVGAARDQGVTRVGEGECLAITTGAVLPPGADTVVRLEDVREHTGSIALAGPVLPGAHLRRQGEVWKRGDVVSLAGRRATPQVLAVLAAAGTDGVLATRKPRVRILGTGDELVAHTGVPGPGCLRASNPWMLRGLAAGLGCDVETTCLCPDDTSEIARRLEALDGCDVVIVSGGVSGGRFDLVPGALRMIGADVVFAGVRMRPGKGTILAVRDDRPIFCLPGTPVGAFVGFQAIVKPALWAMLGVSGEDQVRLRATVTAPIEKPEGVARLVPARLRMDSRQYGDSGHSGDSRDFQAGPMVEPVALCGGGDVVGLARVTCMVTIGEADRSAKAGDLVEVEML
jgi:molybdopterin molybdotransferase